MEVHACQHCKHIGLQKRDKYLERGKCECHEQWRDRNSGPNAARAEQHGDKAAKHFQRRLVPLQACASRIATLNQQRSALVVEYD